MQSLRLGSYIDTGIISNGRPVFQNENDHYLFHTGYSWDAGADYLTDLAGLTSPEESDCPPSAGYQIWTGGSWDATFDVSAACLSDYALTSSGTQETWADHVRQNERVEQELAAIVPNYRKVWFARNLVFKEYNERGGRHNKFGKRMLQYNSSAKAWNVKPWLLPIQPGMSSPCSSDDDRDGYTSGEELGDPCCIWEGKGGPDVAWSWGVTHPSSKSGSPDKSRQKLIKEVDCEEVRRTGRYPDYSDDFDAFFYRDFEQEEAPLTDKAVRLVFLCLYFGVLLWWSLEKELWREILCFITFSRHRATDRTLSLSTGLFLFCFAYAHNDLSSAFVHSFFDNCHHLHPLVGGQCKGTQFHHARPRSQSLESMLLIIGNPIAILPAAFVVVFYGYLGSGFRYPAWLKTGHHYPRWFEFLLLSLAV